MSTEVEDRLHVLAWKLTAERDEARAALKDVERRHEALRVAVLNALSNGPDGWASIHVELAAAFNADRPAVRPKDTTRG